MQSGTHSTMWLWSRLDIIIRWTSYKLFSKCNSHHIVSLLTYLLNCTRDTPLLCGLSLQRSVSRCRKSEVDRREIELRARMLPSNKKKFTTATLYLSVAPSCWSEFVARRSYCIRNVPVCKCILMLPVSLPFVASFDDNAIGLVR